MTTVQNCVYILPLVFMIDSTHATFQPYKLDKGRYIKLSDTLEKSKTILAFYAQISTIQDIRELLGFKIRLEKGMIWERVVR